MAYTGDLNERARSLREGIAKLSNDPTLTLGANYSPGTAQALAQQQAELSDIQEMLNQSNIDKTLGLFNQYSPQVSEEADRQAINDLFNTQQSSQLQALNDVFAQQRGQALDEAAVNGNLRQPGFQASTLNNIDALKAKAVEQLFAQLGIGRNQAILDANARNRELGFNKARIAAGIMQGGQQFGDELSFNRDKFNTSTGLTRREQDLNDLFRRDALSEQIRARDNSGPDWMDRVGKGIGIVTAAGNSAGSLFGKSESGGLSGGSLGQLFKPKQKTAGVD